MAQVSAVAVLVLGTGAFFVVIGNGSTGDPQPLVLALWVLAYAIAGVVLVDGLVRLRRPVAMPAELFIFLSLAVASTFWSQSVELTVRRGFGLVGTVLVGLLLAQRLTSADLLSALRRAMLFLAAVSLGLYAAGSFAVIDPVHGTLRGVVATKNSLGFFMALGLVACAAHYLLEPQCRRRQVISAAPMLLALSLTDSKSGIVIAAAVAAVTLAVLLSRRQQGWHALLAGCCLLSAVGLLLLPYASLEAGAQLLGEDTTLTGRDAVWEESLHAAQRHPVLGYGYGAFWEGTDAAQQIQGRLQWPVPTAHNGVLEVLLGLGRAGAVSALAIVAGLFGRGLADLRGGRRWEAALRLPVAVLLVTSNVVESNFLVQNNVLTLLVVAALGMRRQQEKQRAGAWATLDQSGDCGLGAARKSETSGDFSPQLISSGPARFLS